MEVDNPVDKPVDPSTADPDPIVASYKVYANPALETNRKLVIMQHPNKQGRSNQPYSRVTNVRIKNRSGMVEVDVPISHGNADYDRDKGQLWGGALAKSMASKNGGTHGLAGGFGVGVSSLRPNKRRDEFERDIDMMGWNEAVRQDRVLRTQTLGGQIPPESATDCQWVVGVFKGNKLHLTPASALIQLRPQLHHLDAKAEQDRTSARESSAVGGANEGAAAASGAGARAIHMSIKSADSGGGALTTETMADRLRIVQTEPWGKLQYEDEESGKAWDVFHKNLLYRSKEDDLKNKDEAKDKGKGKEKETDVIQIDSGSSSDSEQLQTRWDADEFLKAVSSMSTGPERSAGGSGDVVVKKEASAGKTPSGSSSTPGPGKTPNSKGKSVAFS